MRLVLTKVKIVSKLKEKKAKGKDQKGVKDNKNKLQRITIKTVTD